MIYDKYTTRVSRYIVCNRYTWEELTTHKLQRESTGIVQSKQKGINLIFLI